MRSIARDLGNALGCKAHVKSLRRIWSGPFQATEGVTLDQVDAMAKSGELDAFLQPLEVGLSDLPEVRCQAESVAKLRNGNPASVIASDVEYGEEVWASYDGNAIAVGTYRGGDMQPARVFVS